MSIARSIQIIAHTQHPDKPRAGFFAAALLAVSVPAVDQRTIAGFTVHAYADGSFLALGDMANPEAIDLEFADVVGTATMADRWQVLEENLPAIVKSGQDGAAFITKWRQGIGGLLDEAARATATLDGAVASAEDAGVTRPPVPTGTVDLGPITNGKSCMCAACRAERIRRTGAGS